MSYKNTISKLQDKIQNKIRVRTLIGIVLLLAGISLASFPYFHNMYYQHIQASQVEQKLAEFQEKENPSFVAEDRAYERNVTQDVYEDKDQEEEQSDERFANELEPDDGILEIPAINLQLTIGYGVELSDLESSPGFYPESGTPETGNVSIAGHRTTYGAPFNQLNELDEDDDIYLYYQDKKYTYKVSEVFDTHKHDWTIIEPTSEPALTLTTCHPPGSSERRLIVRAYLDDSKDDF
ncbi:class E sortase [Natranaerofaba carboxydovora]|uniref:class E sortase n=1 Tax=Natranaerofaba carboxydovora TaxID=2742683 RepID=UPI001F1387C9|nr:class E sortase [Natranaerofaba carboxydovora]UMZ74332.1 Sortase family protein [Natranaerofaba carboxydovora]